MGEILHFRQRLSLGQSEFMLCGRCDQESAFLPIVSHNQSGPFITELVCIGPTCDGSGTVLEIINGEVTQ